MPPIPTGSTAPSDDFGPYDGFNPSGPYDPSDPSDPSDPKGTVRRGYDMLAERYDEAFGSSAKYGPWLAALRDRLPPQGADVLDLGCGGGVPVARDLAAAGHRVTGVDLSPRQIARARAHVPGATFVEADATDRSAFDPRPLSFDAVVCLYTLIHLPVPQQRTLVHRIAGWLRPGGWLLCVTGETALTDATDPDWLGGGVPMWWSHPDAATSRAWLREAGMDVVQQEFVPEGDVRDGGYGGFGGYGGDGQDDVRHGHALFWATKGPGKEEEQA